MKIVKMCEGNPQKLVKDRGNSVKIDNSHKNNEFLLIWIVILALL